MKIEHLIVLVFLLILARKFIFKYYLPSENEKAIVEVVHTKEDKKSDTFSIDYDESIESKPVFALESTPAPAPTATPHLDPTPTPKIVTKASPSPRPIPTPPTQTATVPVIQPQQNSYENLSFIPTAKNTKDFYGMGGVKLHLKILSTAANHLNKDFNFDKVEQLPPGIHSFFHPKFKHYGMTNPVLPIKILGETYEKIFFKNIRWLTKPSKHIGSTAYIIFDIIDSKNKLIKKESFHLKKDKDKIWKWYGNQSDYIFLLSFNTTKINTEKVIQTHVGAFYSYNPEVNRIDMEKYNNADAFVYNSQNQVLAEFKFSNSVFYRIKTRLFPYHLLKLKKYDVYTLKIVPKDPSVKPISMSQMISKPPGNAESNIPTILYPQKASELCNAKATYSLRWHPSEDNNFFHLFVRYSRSGKTRTFFYLHKKTTENIIEFNIPDGGTDGPWELSLGVHDGIQHYYVKKLTCKR